MQNMIYWRNDPLFTHRGHSLFSALTCKIPISHMTEFLTPANSIRSLTFGEKKSRLEARGDPQGRRKCGSYTPEIHLELDGIEECGLKPTSSA